MASDGATSGSPQLTPSELDRLEVVELARGQLHAERLSLDGFGQFVERAFGCESLVELHALRDEVAVDLPPDLPGAARPSSAPTGVRAVAVILVALLATITWSVTRTTSGDSDGSTDDEASSGEQAPGPLDPTTYQDLGGPRPARGPSPYTDPVAAADAYVEAIAIEDWPAASAMLCDGLYEDFSDPAAFATQVRDEGWLPTSHEFDDMIELANGDVTFEVSYLAAGGASNLHEIRVQQVDGRFSACGGGRFREPLNGLHLGYHVPDP